MATCLNFESSWEESWSCISLLFLVLLFFFGFSAFLGAGAINKYCGDLYVVK
jgi:hypothetical protein